MSTENNKRMQWSVLSLASFTANQLNAKHLFIFKQTLTDRDLFIRFYT